MHSEAAVIAAMNPAFQTMFAVTGIRRSVSDWGVILPIADSPSIRTTGAAMWGACSALPHSPFLMNQRVFSKIFELR